jgi:acetaldehyde dehydrogenase (acetylating)
MNRIDNDLLSIQETRILVENAREAQKLLRAFPQEKLDEIVECMAGETRKHARELAELSCEETEYGKCTDKYIKNIFVCDFLCNKLKNMRCVGIISEDNQNKTIDIGVPVGVIAALPPATNPVSTTIYKTLIAIKSGNAIVFSPHPRAKKTIGKVLDLIILAAEKCGLPEGAIAYLHTPTHGSTVELMNHKDTSLILITGVPKMLKEAYASGKPVIYGGAGNGPAFIERSADIKKAVADIIASRTFDNGIVSASEQSIVADGCVAEDIRRELKSSGAYFMSEQESKQLGLLLLNPDGSANSDIIGKSAVELARCAGICVPCNTKVLISEQKYVSSANPYSRQKLCPVLAFFVEDDWMHACEKCIELLLTEGRGHTLVIHSKNEAVIREFALKKPVSRVLVNTPGTFGGMGVTTNLFPAMTLGSGAAGGGATSDNVSPMNLINIRKVGYGVRQIEDISNGVYTAGTVLECDSSQPDDNCTEDSQDLSLYLKKILNQMM